MAPTSPSPAGDGARQGISTELKAEALTEIAPQTQQEPAATQAEADRIDRYVMAEHPFEDDGNVPDRWEQPS
jgi:hypothetical protein